MVENTGRAVSLSRKLLETKKVSGREVTLSKAMTSVYCYLFVGIFLACKN